MKKRVLQVVSSLSAGGAETMLMNIYRNIDRERVQFDFVVFGDNESFYENEVYSLGGRIHRIIPIREKGIIQFISSLINIIKNNGPYIAVHSHIDYLSGLVALAARIARVDKRISHSHNANAVTYKGELDKYKLKVVQKLINMNSTNLLACSINSAVYMFGDKSLDKVKIINNSIDVDAFNKELTLVQYESFCKEFKIDKNSKIIGHIGRFVTQKNHKRLIDICNCILQKYDNTFIILVGDGPLRSEIEEYAKTLEIYNKIRFVGLRSDISDLMKLFDVFMLPSLFEGLPVTLVEAQAAGRECIVSNNISKEVDLGLGLIKFIDLDKDNKIWLNEVIDSMQKNKIDRRLCKNMLIEKGYYIKNNMELIYKIYEV